ncbi:MAG: flagellar biosynthesis protein FlhB [Vallitaleaceae bacterium]|jgi:flagellar biosynthetic protein FlhB|nr:flagellar biosynthesis protein FlhB [Vallitaleaceae bacterium]
MAQLMKTSADYYGRKHLISMNLQFFAEDGAGEKTEQPTSKKKEKAREDGRVAKSTEVTSAVLLFTMFSAFKIFGPASVEAMLELTGEMYRLFGIKTIDVNYASSIIGYVVMTIIKILLPYFIVAVLVALVTNLAQVGWHPTMKPLEPKFNKFNPIEGFKRMFSMKSIIELIKSLLKIAFILAIVYNSIKNYEELILMIYNLPLLDAYGMIINICFDVGVKVGGFFLIIAAIDYAYQRYDLNKKLKMTKQEVKDEYKQSEGNPEIKSRIRQKMREASMRRMMQDLPIADVIITNPTHFAVAVQYDVSGFGAPIVLAKGADLMAARIREKAKEYDIEMVENRALARTLYYTVDIGDEIPPELYQVVAEILAMVYTLRDKAKEGTRV